MSRKCRGGSKKEEKEVVKTITNVVEKEIEVDTNALVELIGAESDLIEKITDDLHLRSYLLIIPQF